MSNLIQCIRCKQTLIKEESDEHICTSGKFKGVRDIEVIQWWETTSEDGERVAFGLGSDGYNYRMREMKEGFIEIDPKNIIPRRKFPERRSDGDFPIPDFA
jgi:hypothetical protein